MVLGTPVKDARGGPPTWMLKQKEARCPGNAGLSAHLRRAPGSWLPHAGTQRSGSLARLVRAPPCTLASFSWRLVLTAIDSLLPPTPILPTDEDAGTQGGKATPPKSPNTTTHCQSLARGCRSRSIGHKTPALPSAAARGLGLPGAPHCWTRGLEKMGGSPQPGPGPGSWSEGMSLLQILQLG